MAQVLKGDAALSAGSVRLPARGAPAEAAAPTVPQPPAHTPAPVVPAAPTASVAAPAPAPAALPEAELDALRQRARQEGHEEGRKQAQQQVEAAIERQETAWRTALAGLQSAVDDKLRDTEAFAVAIAFEACARVLGDVAVDGHAMAAVVQRLLEHTREGGLLRVQLPPADVESVKRTLQDDPHWQHRALRFEADPALKAGDCRVASPHGQIETGLAVQLAAIQESLLATFAERSAAKARGPEA